MTQALYRRYRPVTFAEVIGQDHVTGPLQQALKADRTHHAYLFSGPRGCGKTTSARIMARCLNCVAGPTPTPCGTCASCQALAPGGGGSLDVIELDAATHGLVDDARDLRERAFFAPASSRYKVYVVDEAHMLTTSAANALLKIVEEPPPHLKFVFATTEPEKVIATVRSRVHHYPFRLVAPGVLAAYLAQVCEKEGVVADRGALSVVVRAGRGSVRDALSILDQLMAGAPESGISYPYAAGLLGLTDATLLDDTVEAFAAGDAATVFQVVDRVVEAGHDPRRFAEDLLERLRDLIVLDAVPDAAGSILGEHPADELDRMRQQCAHFGAAALSRAADIVNAGLIEMRGATAARLQLELMCARVLLPAAGDDSRGLAARLDRLERRAAIAGPVAEPAPAPSAAVASDGAARRTPEAAAPTATAPAAPAAAQPAATEASEAAHPADTPAAAGTLDLVTVRRLWPEVLEEVKALRRYTWTLLSHNAQVAALDGSRLTLALVNAGARDSFLRGGSEQIVREALIKVLGVDWTVEAILDPSTAPATAEPTTSEPAADRLTNTVASTTERSPAARRGRSGRAAAAKAGLAREKSPQQSRVGAADVPSAEDPDVPSADDPDADDAGLSGPDLLARELGATVIGQYDAS